MRMKVEIFINNCSCGGVGTSTYILARGMRKAGHQAYILASDGVKRVWHLQKVDCKCCGVLEIVGELQHCADCPNSTEVCWLSQGEERYEIRKLNDALVRILETC